MASKKHSAVILRKLYSCEYNPKVTENTEEIVSVMKDYSVVPPKTFADCVLGYLAKFGAKKADVDKLLADPNYYFEFEKSNTTCAIRVAVSPSKYSIFISKKASGWVYGHSFAGEQLVCRIKSFKAPISVFNPDMPSIYKIVFNNHIEELEARFSLRRQ